MSWNARLIDCIKITARCYEQEIRSEKREVLVRGKTRKTILICHDMTVSVITMFHTEAKETFEGSLSGFKCGFSVIEQLYF